jgi:CBS domain-containing protein
VRLFIYLSEILGRKVVDVHQRPVGRVVDFTMILDEKVFPRAETVIVKRFGMPPRYTHIPIQSFTKLSKVFSLQVPSSDLSFGPRAMPDKLLVCRDVLDQQVVDLNHQKVVRVNDVHLLRVDNQIYLAHVDVGMRGLIRRLDWTPAVDWVVKTVNPRSEYLEHEELIAWKHTQSRTIGRSKNALKSSGARKKLARIPTAKLADIMEDLDIFERISVFEMFGPEMQRKLFTDLAPGEKLEILDQLNDKAAANLLAQIPADEATDVLTRMSRSTRRLVMRHMRTETSNKLRNLLGFAQDSAGGLMTTDYLRLSRHSTVADALALVKSNVTLPGNIYHIYITDDDNRLLGATSLRRFIHRDPDTAIIETSFPYRIFVRTDDGMEEIAMLLEKHKFTSIPVLDDDDVLQGVITIDDVLEELITLIWTKYKDQI